MKPLPTLLTVTLIVVAVSVLFALYSLLVLPLQSLGIFLVALGLGIAVLAKRFGRLLSLQRGTFSLSRSPLVLSFVLVAVGISILLFGVLPLLALALFAWGWVSRGGKHAGLEPSLGKMYKQSAPLAKRHLS